ncbi:conserved hypothetical protein [gamma proteobacterium HTCC5015]|nr:conserved hypothetical protein [gamma proteobacterium HTCC5015]
MDSIGAVRENQTQRIRRCYAQLTLFVSALFAASSVIAAPAADLWEHWAQHDERNPASIDHQPWQHFLNQFVHSTVDDRHNLDYAAVSPRDHQSLKDYLSALQSVKVTQLRRSEQLAYWVNLYNAQLASVILDAYPVDSVQDIDLSGLFSNGPWDAVLLEIEGEPITLNDIHHRILRPIWRDPMIHYALSCGAIGCPNLAQEAYTANNSRGLMSEAAFEFINHPRGIAFREDGTVSISSLYHWYAEDFSEGEPLFDHLRQYALPSLARRLQSIDHSDAEHFDWQLNDHSRTP